MDRGRWVRLSDDGATSAWQALPYEEIISNQITKKICGRSNVRLRPTRCANVWV
jgi:hypothetical protein